MPVRKSGMLWAGVPCGLKPKRKPIKLAPVIEPVPEPIISILPMIPEPLAPILEETILEIIEKAEPKVVLVKETIKEEIVKQLEKAEEIFNRIIEETPKEDTFESEKSPFACELCDYIGKNIRALAMHKRAKHE